MRQAILVYNKLEAVGGELEYSRLHQELAKTTKDNRELEETLAKLIKAELVELVEKKVFYVRLIK